MNLGKFFFILTLVMCFGLLFSAQRMDSYDKTQTIRALSRELESINSRKQELTLSIRTENDRLLLQSHHMGTPLAAKDVILLENVPGSLP